MDQWVVRIIRVRIDQSSLHVKPASLNEGPQIVVEFVEAGPLRTRFDHLVDLTSVLGNELMECLREQSL